MSKNVTNHSNSVSRAVCSPARILIIIKNIYILALNFCENFMKACNDFLLIIFIVTSETYELLYKISNSKKIDYYSIYFFLQRISRRWRYYINYKWIRVVGSVEHWWKGHSHRSNKESCFRRKYRMGSSHKTSGQNTCKFVILYLNDGGKAYCKPTRVGIMILPISATKQSCI